MLLAGSVAYFVATSWWRVVDAFVQGLPAEGRVEAGVLEWPNKPGVATSNRHLEIRVSAGKPTSSASTSDFTLGFFRDRIRIAGVLGYVDLAYRDFQLDFPLNSIDIAPYWEAWKNPMIVFSGFLSAVVILATWWILSVIYSPMTRVMASLCGPTELAASGSSERCGLASSGSHHSRCHCPICGETVEFVCSWRGLDSPCGDWLGLCLWRRHYGWAPGAAFSSNSG